MRGPPRSRRDVSASLGGQSSVPRRPLVRKPVTRPRLCLGANAFYHKLFAIFDVKPVYVDNWKAANLALRTIPPTVPEQTQEQVGEPPAQIE